MNILLIFFTIFSFLHCASGDERSVIHQHRYHIDHETLKLLVPLSRYAQISYCLGTLENLRPPFRCRYGCTQFPKTELLNQWWQREWIDSPVAGYIALDHARKLLVVMFRGAHSTSDIFQSMRFRQTEFVPWKSEETGWEDPEENPFYCNGTFIDPDSGRYVDEGCKIHSGVNHMYKRTMWHLDEHLREILDHGQYPDYRFVIAGHSMGGIIAALVGADYKMRGYDPTVVSFGSPKFGNRGFANWFDKLFDTQGQESVLTDHKRRYFRVTQKHDAYTHLPLSPWYFHTSGEVFISDCDVNEPDEETVYFCAGQENSLCSHTTYINPIALMFNELIHMHYFTDLHGCALDHAYVPITDVPPPTNTDNPY